MDDESKKEETPQTGSPEPIMDSAESDGTVEKVPGSPHKSFPRDVEFPQSSISIEWEGPQAPGYHTTASGGIYIGAPADPQGRGGYQTTTSATSGGIYIGASGPTGPGPGAFGLGLKPEEIAYQRKNYELKAGLAEKTSKIRELQREKELSEEKTKEYKELFDSATKDNEELKKRETMGSVLMGIHSDARPLLLSSEDLQKKFLEGGACNAYVMSIDIRRSTELMLKSRSPELFAEFITSLCEELVNIVLRFNGVLEKFTGDGILAFFPTFYSGNDAGYYALLAAHEAHKAFRRFYYKHRNYFDVVLVGVGLGIGVDCGEVHLLQFNNSLTLVGRPVVYACRMGGAPAGTTLLNQPAYEEIVEKYSASCSCQETEIKIKNDGPVLAYEVRLDKHPYDPEPPAWVKLLEEAVKPS